MQGQGTGQGRCTAPDDNTLCLLPTFTLLLKHPHQHHVQTALFNTAALLHREKAQAVHQRAALGVWSSPLQRCLSGAATAMK